MRMGAGPERLMESGLIDRLQQAGHEVVPCSVCLPSQKFIPEVQAAFELDRRLADCVAEAVAAGARFLWFCREIASHRWALLPASASLSSA